MSNFWLVTGGNGYIGSHIVQALTSIGEPLLVLDIHENLLNHGSIKNVSYVKCDIRSLEQINLIFSKYDIQGVLHFAALKSVYESSIIPNEYVHTNVVGTKNILDSMVKHGVRNLVFPSTAAVYGETREGLFTEQSHLNPGSVYGSTKLDGERLIEQYCTQYSLNAFVFRFFNVAGQLLPFTTKKSVDNFIPIAVANYKNKIRSTVFGYDYLTPDRTAIRDYVHVGDIVEVCKVAVEQLNISSGTFEILNIGGGKGFSVLEVLSEISQQFGEVISPVLAPRRPGDLPIAIAEATLLRKILGYRNKYSLSEIVSSLI